MAHHIGAPRSCRRSTHAPSTMQRCVQRCARRSVSRLPPKRNPLRESNCGGQLPSARRARQARRLRCADTPAAPSARRQTALPAFSTHASRCHPVVARRPAVEETCAEGCAFGAACRCRIAACLSSLRVDNFITVERGIARVAIGILKKTPQTRAHSGRVWVCGAPLARSVRFSTPCRSASR